MSDFLYVGTYSEKSGVGPGPWGRGDGIHVFAFDSADGALHATGAVAAARNPSYLAIDREAGRLFCAEELGEFGGAVGVFAVDRASGDLRRIGSAATGGSHPCHLALDPARRLLSVTNYSAGGSALLRVAGDGALSLAAQIADPPGAGPHPTRQAVPHPHASVFDPTGRHLYVTDLGGDAIHRYDPRPGGEAAAVSLASEAGAGPRQIVLCPTGATAYVVNELACSLTVYRRDPESGALEPWQTLPTRPADWSGDGTAAELQLAPDGRHVYVSNRGHDSLAVFARDPDGRLAATSDGDCGHASTLGRTPRSFAIHPGGRWVVAANQDSDSLVVFARDPQTGGLTATGAAVAVGSPVCPRFF